MMHHGSMRTVRRKSAYLVEPVIVQSRAEFALIWIYVVLVHTLAGLCILVVGLAYATVLTLSKGNGALQFLQMTDIELNESAAWFFVVVGGVVVAYNLSSAFQAVLRSVHARKLVFRAKQVKQDIELETSTPCWQLPVLPLLWVWWWVSAFAAKVSSIIGVRGSYFEFAFLLREVVEVAMQTLQCYNNSQHVTRMWLNRFSVVILIINCWSTPIIHILLRHHKVRPVIRCCCLAADVCLDLMTSLLMPALVLWPYIVIMIVGGTDENSSFNPIWLVQAQSELRTVIFTSWTVMLAQLLPMLSCIQALQDIKALFDFSPRIAPTVDDEGEHEDSEQTQPSYVHPKSHILLNIAHALFVVHGVLVIALSIDGYSRGSNADPATCIVQLFPWIGNRLSCAAIAVNCAHLQLQGDLNEIDRVIEPLEFEGVRSISFANCPALEISPIVTQMSDLLVFNIYNSTITRWDATAAITAANMPVLGAIYIVSSSFEPLRPSKFPLGLLHRDLPASLTMLQVMNSSIDIPDEFGSKWRNEGLILAFEMCNLSTIPAGLLSIQNAFYISLAVNAIQEVPSELFAVVEALTLNGNPIHELPVSQPDKLLTKRMWLVGTNISKLPDWTIREELINGWASPMCSIGVDNRTNLDCLDENSVMALNLSKWIQLSDLDVQ